MGFDQRARLTCPCGSRHKTQGLPGAVLMRIQSHHTDADRGADPYFSPPEATASLLHIDREFLPGPIWEPAAGDGAIARPLQDAGFTVISSDLLDYGWHGSRSGVDYLKAKPPAGVEAIVTNPAIQDRPTIPREGAERGWLHRVADANELPRKLRTDAPILRVPTEQGLDLIKPTADDASVRLGRPALYLEHMPFVVHLGHAA
jgi:hypothetical protein